VQFQIDEEGKMKKSSLAVSFVLLALLVAALPSEGLCASPSATAPIVWKALGPFQYDYPETQLWVLPFIKKVNDRAKGRLRIEYVGGPEVVPTFEQLKPVSTGTFQLIGAIMVYFYPVFPAAAVTAISPSYAEQQRAVGLSKMLDDLWQKQVGVKYLPITFDDRFHFYLRKPVKTLADFSGLKIRSIFIWDALVKSLGATAVNMALPEVYSGLERGVVDGLITVETGFMTYRFHEVTKHVVYPGFGHPASGILINLDAWKALPDDLKALVEQVGIDQEKETMEAIGKLARKEQQELVEKAGMKRIDLSPTDSAELLRKWEEESWKGLVYNRLPDVAPKLRGLAQEAERMIKR
jgi:TRAP-type C4-dicarboxylate transport system substrate-binding protein